MQPPPTYYEAPPPKKTNWGLIIAILGGVVGLCCILPAIGLGVFGYGFMQKAKGFINCGRDISEFRDAVVAYAKAHDNTLPRAATWQDDVAPYMPPRKTVGASVPNRDVCDEQAGTSIMFNAALSGKRLKQIQDPYTIVLWEAAGPGHNRSATFKELAPETGPKMVGTVPRGWIEQPLQGMPFWRGRGGVMQPVPVKSNAGVKGGFTVTTSSSN